MPSSQLKETTMKLGRRSLVRVDIAEDAREETDTLVERLMGRKPELRFAFIQENAKFAREAVDI
jgi:topoisomerase-4 subunit B